MGIFIFLLLAIFSVIMPVVGLVIAVIAGLIVMITKGTVTNIIAMDGIIILAVSTYFIHKAGLHIVFSIMLGLVAVAIFVALTKIPYFGKPFVVILGLGWAFAFYQLIDFFGIFCKNNPELEEKMGGYHFLSNLAEKDPIWWWTIVILLIIGFVGLHLKCVLKSNRVEEESEEEESPDPGEAPHDPSQ